MMTINLDEKDLGLRSTLSTSDPRRF